MAENGFNISPFSLPLEDRVFINRKDIFGGLCFNVFYGNKDDHGKNFAFLFDEKLDGYKLSPFYDITRTPDKAEHEMTAAGSGNPTEKDLLEVARQTALDIEKCRKSIANVREVLNN